jgi:hypothetical protein
VSLLPASDNSRLPPTRDQCGQNGQYLRGWRAGEFICEEDVCMGVGDVSWEEGADGVRGGYSSE